MKFSYLLGGLGVATTLALTVSLATIGTQNLGKPAEIIGLQEQITEKTYPTVPKESRQLPRTGPSFPSPGYEN